MGLGLSEYLRKEWRQVMESGNPAGVDSKLIPVLSGSTETPPLQLSPAGDGASQLHQCYPGEKRFLIRTDSDWLSKPKGRTLLLAT
jgi:hypothetical protein